MSTDSQNKHPTLLNTLNPKLLVFTVLMLPLLVSLGFWQLSREVEKKALLQMMEDRTGQPPQSLQALEDRSPESLSFLPLRVEGIYDNQHTFLLDNRTHEGRSGVEVISPFVTVDGQTLLVNRGWVARGAYRTDLPDIEPVSAQVMLTGQVYVQQEAPFMLGDESPFSGWPRVLQALDTGLMFDELDVGSSSQALQHTFRLQAGVPGVFEPYWQPVNMLPAKHRGYAVQWFAMAIVLAFLYLYSIRSVFRLTQQKR